MTILFQREEELFVFQDPTNEGELVHRKTEIRFDPLTGESSRIVFDPGLKLTPPDYAEIGKETSGKKCPFCDENVYRITPKFPESISLEGRFREGEAILFPNLFPYSKHNGVAVFSGQHYVPLQEFTEEMIVNAFRVAQVYLNKVTDTDPAVRHASINWNYLPYSGSSILHPHIHIIASEQPTNYQSRNLRAAQEFYRRHQENYYKALAEEEKKLGERWIIEEEFLSWFHAFAPKSHADFVGIFSGCSSLGQLSEQHWQVLARGLMTIFRYFDGQGLASFNLILNIPIQGMPEDAIHVRIVPRLTIGALGTSDMNFFQILHQEPLSYKVPEEVAQEVRALFTL